MGNALRKCKVPLKDAKYSCNANALVFGQQYPGTARPDFPGKNGGLSQGRFIGVRLHIVSWERRFMDLSLDCQPDNLARSLLSRLFR